MLLELIFNVLLRKVTDRHTHARTNARTRSPLLGLLSEPKRVILWMIDDILPLNIVQTALSLTKLDRFTLTEAAERASG